MSALSEHIILGIDPGLVNTGWGIVAKQGHELTCLAYGCIKTGTDTSLDKRLEKIYGQIGAIIDRYKPDSVGVETIWFGENVSAAFGTGQARGAALVACGEAGLKLGEYTPNLIKASVVGVGKADKAQVQYMVKQILRLESVPKPDHAADALAAAICFAVMGPVVRQME